MTLAIHGLATAVPPGSLPQTSLLEAVKILCHASPEQARILSRIYSHSGIRQRHMIVGEQLIRDILDGTRQSQSIFLPGASQKGPTTSQRMREYRRHASRLALPAARRALAQAGVEPAQITHIVTVSCTGFHAPGVDVELIQGLGLPDTTERVHVGFMGCHGAINGLRAAHGLANTCPNGRVLMCAVELCSVHCVYEWNLETMVASALFSDGAAALVGSAAPSGQASATDDWQLAATGSCVFPGSTDAMSWTVGDHGFDMTLSPRVPDLIAGHLPAWMDDWLRQQGLARSDVASWCLHPGGPRIITAVEESLGLEKGASDVAREILAEYGNMSSATILFILERLMRQHAPRPCVALGFGPGLTAEAALFR